MRNKLNSIPFPDPIKQLKLNYSAKEHKGFDHVLPTVVRGGRAVPFTDWSTAVPK